MCTKDILTLAGRYAKAMQIAPPALSRRATKSGTWLERCATGDVTIRSAADFVQWLSDHWPSDLEWPTDIERPKPTKGSRVSAFARSEAETEAQAELRKNDEFAAAIRLGASKEIACPSDFCRALCVRRAVYDSVVRRYRDDIGAGDWPRPGTESDRVLLVLAVSGDVRFASRRAAAAA